MKDELIEKLQEDLKEALKNQRTATEHKLEEAQDKYDKIQKQMRQKAMKDMIKDKLSRRQSEKSPQPNDE